MIEIMNVTRIIVTILLLNCVTITSAFEAAGLHFRVIDEENMTVEVTYMLPNDTLNYANCSHIDIPESVQDGSLTYEVKAIGDSAFRMARSLKTISIPNGVTRIGKEAFYASGLTDVSLPPSVTELGAMAFGLCYYLRRCQLNDKIQELPLGIFAETYSLRTMYLPPQIKVIGSLAFYYSALGSVELPEGLERIKDYAFAQSSLRKIRIPDQVNTIGHMAFNYVPLDTVLFGKSLRQIGERAFSECYNLSYINELPNSLQIIGGGAFGGANFSLIDLIVPGSVSYVGNYAFSMTGLRSVVFEQGVDTIAEYAFSNCNLSQVEIPASVSYLGSQAFGSNQFLVGIYVDQANAHYSSAEGVLYNKQQDSLLLYPMGREGIVRLPENVRVVDDLAFYACKKLTTVILNEGLTKVGRAAFQYCEQLDSVHVPMSIESWGVDAMEYTKWSNERNRGLQYLGPVALNNKRSMYNNYIIKEGTTCIADGAFSLNDNLTYVKLPKGLKYIGVNSFCNNRNLKSIRLPESVKRIGHGAFNSNIKLLDINIPEGIESIEQCFNLSANLKHIYCYCKRILPVYWYWLGLPDNNCILYVPKGYKEIYEQVCGGEFASIQEMGPVGDFNNDFLVDVEDVNQIIDMILGESEGNFFLSDLDGDQIVDVTDLNGLIDLILRLGK